MASTSKRTDDGKALWQRQLQGMNSIMRQTQTNNPPKSARPTRVLRKAGSAPHRDNITDRITRREQKNDVRQARMRPDNRPDTSPKARHQDNSRRTEKSTETAIDTGAIAFAGPIRIDRRTQVAPLNEEKDFTHIPHTRKRAPTEEIDRIEVKKPRLSQSGTVYRGQATAPSIQTLSRESPVSTTCKPKKPGGMTRKECAISSHQQQNDTSAAAKTFIPQHEVANVACLISPIHPPSPPATPEEPVVTRSASQANMIKQVRQQKPRHRSPQAFAPIHPTSDVEHEYVPYDDNSIPIMRSTIIKHRKDVLRTHPSIELKGRALVLLDRGFKAEDLGRPDMIKRGPTLVIDDCDLYLRDKKVHVACERGTLLVATYLKLRGIPDKTPVRFNGVKPAWAQASLPQRHFRRVQHPTKYDNPDYVLEPWEPPEAKPWLEPLKPGQLALDASSVVEVFVRDSKGLCYGRRLDKKDKSHKKDKRHEEVEDGDEGWFHYGITVGLNDHYEGGGEGAFKPQRFDDVSPTLQARISIAKSPGHLQISTAPARNQVATSSISSANKQSALKEPSIEIADVARDGPREPSNKWSKEALKAAILEPRENVKEDPKQGSQEACAIQTNEQHEKGLGKGSDEEPKDKETNTILKQHAAPERNYEAGEERGDLTPLLTIRRADIPMPPPYGSIEDEVDWDDDEL